MIADISKALSVRGIRLVLSKKFQLAIVPKIASRL
jgi:hypothetical protein